MSRQKLSSIARANDLIKSLAAELDNISKDYNTLTVANERLKDIEPALRRLQAALGPVIPETVQEPEILIEDNSPLITPKIPRSRKRKGAATNDTGNNAEAESNQDNNK